MFKGGIGLNIFKFIFIFVVTISLSLPLAYAGKANDDVRRCNDLLARAGELIKNKDFKAAANFLKEEIGESPYPHAENHEHWLRLFIHMAEAEFRLRNYERANELMIEALETYKTDIENPTAARAIYMRAQALFGMGEYEAAFQQLKTSLKLDPDNKEYQNAEKHYRFKSDEAEAEREDAEARKANEKNLGNGERSAQNAGAAVPVARKTLSPEQIKAKRDEANTHIWIFYITGEVNKLREAIRLLRVAGDAHGDHNQASRLVILTSILSRHEANPGQHRMFARPELQEEAAQFTINPWRNELFDLRTILELRNEWANTSNASSHQVGELAQAIFRKLLLDIENISFEPGINFQQRRLKMLQELMTGLETIHWKTESLDGSPKSNESEVASRMRGLRNLFISYIHIEMATIMLVEAENAKYNFKKEPPDPLMGMADFHDRLLAHMKAISASKLSMPDRVKTLSAGFLYSRFLNLLGENAEAKSTITDVVALIRVASAELLKAKEPSPTLEAFYRKIADDVSLWVSEHPEVMAHGDLHIHDFPEAADGN